MEVPGRNFARARLTISLAPLVAPKGVILVGTELMPNFVNSTSLVSKSVIRRYITVNFKVKVNLGQSSIIMLL